MMLSLRKETVTELTPGDLADVVGASCVAVSCIGTTKLQIPECLVLSTITNTF